MKEIINKVFNFDNVEFWAASTIFVFAVFFVLNQGIADDLSGIITYNRHYFDEESVPFNYYGNYFIPTIFRYIGYYGAFILMNFKFVPALIKKEKVFLNVMYIIASFLVLGLAIGATDVNLKYYLFYRYSSEHAAFANIFHNSFLQTVWLLLVFAFYTLIKYSALYIINNSAVIRSKYKVITLNVAGALLVWIVGIFLLALGDAHTELIIGWAILILSGILLYWLSFYTLIPKSFPKKRPFLRYIWKTLLVLVLSFFPVMLMAMILTRQEEDAVSYSMLNTAFQLLITAPVSWALFKRHIRGNEEIRVLKKELGQSNASFDFLRSQINPHFLFNALNTIYGTAIQEKAERTSEGIEKLGDMMRFMLQENMQDKISLTREIDYLNNYISLQRLRTDPNPAVKIEAEIEQQVNTVQISPMLLIPFVENAFKHGISLRENSFIRISLEVRNNTLYFDVYNSKHVKPENDPEKNKSGIGLNNVRQRLQLLYPGKHELIIRETGKEFFVHLTLDLGSKV